MRFGVQRVEASIANGAFPWTEAENQSIRVREDDLVALRELLPGADKICSYQKGLGGDLYCMIASDKDPTAEMIDGQWVAPTSRPLCRSCSLPSADQICSHLLRPRVLTTTVGPVRKLLIQPDCDQGRAEIGLPGNCYVGGHACAERTALF